jgi:hypothetical protein
MSGWGLIRTLGVCDRSNPNSYRGAEGTESGSRQDYDGVEEHSDFQVFEEIEGYNDWGTVEDILNILM